MKTIHLIHLLDEKEKDELASILLYKKRKSLSKLFDFLSSAQINFAKKELLYKTVFGEKYDTSKDYLLRNELRLLNNEIENLISQKEASLKINEINNGLHLMERMLRKGDVGLFKNVFGETERTATSMQDYGSLLKVYDLYVQHVVKHKEVAVSHYEDMYGILAKREAALKNYADELVAEIQLRRNFSLKVIQLLDGEKHASIKNLKKVSDKSTKTSVVAYLNKYAESYLLDGDDKIACYKQLIKLQPAIAKIRPDRIMDIAALYGNLALSLFLSGKHTEADVHYLTAIKYAEKYKSVYLDLYFNYCVNALLIGKHKEVTVIYDNHFDEIDKNEKLKYRFACFVAIAHLMMGKPDAAFKMLGQDISQRPVTEYYYYRLVYAMVYYQKNDFENAERELENILQSFRFRKTAKSDDKPLVKLMKKMVDAESFRLQKEKYNKEVSKIKNEINDRTLDSSNFSTVIYNWIIWQVNSNMR